MGRPPARWEERARAPGEFQQAVRMGFSGDSLWVWDIDSYRVSYFDLEGEFLGSVSPAVDLGGRDENPARPDRPLRDGTTLTESPY